MRSSNDVPKIAEGGTNVNGMGYTLTWAQRERMRRGQTIYERDRKVEEYKYSKGEFV